MKLLSLFWSDLQLKKEVIKTLSVWNLWLVGSQQPAIHLSPEPDGTTAYHHILNLKY
jgi:hypothetical protein